VETQVLRDAKAYDAYLCFQSKSKAEYDEVYNVRLARLKQQANMTRQTTQQNAGMAYAQYGAALQSIDGMDRALLSVRVRSAPVEGLPDDEKSEIGELVNRMMPMYQRVDQLLPVFLALTNNHEATKRLILMKYLFQDQLDALPRGVFVITLENIRRLKEQLSRYFVWVKNQVQTIGQSPAQMPAAVQVPTTNAAAITIPMVPVTTGQVAHTTLPPDLPSPDLT